MTVPLETRLMRNVHLDLDSGCWVWTGALTKKGYGAMSYQGRMQYVHRLSHRLWVGPIPPRMEIDHKCRNHACFNPAHGHVVTHRQNREHLDIAVNNKSGYRGVSRDRGRWRAQVKIDRRAYNLGLYDTAEEAAEVAAEFRRERMTNSLLDMSKGD